MITLWNIFRSPLMMGGVITDCDDWTLSFLTNDDVLRLNGHSHGAFQIHRNDRKAVWGSFYEDGSFYLVLFNLSEGPKRFRIFLLKSVSVKQMSIAFGNNGRKAMREIVSLLQCLYMVSSFINIVTPSIAFFHFLFLHH